MGGLLIVLEGTDRSGRSTHARRLEQQLRYRGAGVTRTSLATSLLAADPIRAAKHQRRMDPVETVLLYAADLAERIEQVILPSLQAGLVVLADRYVYTPMARAETRGVDGAWLERLFSFAPSPDLTLLLDVDPATALARQGRQGPDRYEAGMDLGLSRDAIKSFRLFQDRLRDWFEEHRERYGFRRIDARGEPEAVAALIEPVVDGLLAGR
ncbi:MAG TPA: dTMP kinase [Candidatus Limnocylindrales bacterium]|nr:dTMP kinase [Candidatus Limnocylindrales bacterium]